MASYYCDGTITSASGTGSGTQADPWGKTDDLWDYCISQIAAAGGAGSQGDELIVLDGGFNQTQNPDLTVVTYGAQQYLYVRPYVLDGTQRIPFDVGTYKVMGTSTNRRGYHFYFCDFTNLSPTNYTIQTNAYGGCYFCVFDGTGSSHSSVLRLGSYSRIIGCHFIDNRTAGLLIQGTNGQMYRWNVFEPSYNGYMMYSYASIFQHNLILPTSSMTYNTGLVLGVHGLNADRNTFYSPHGYGAGFYVPGSYEDNYITNNYFEGIYDEVNCPQTQQHLNTLEVLCGNRSYNITASPSNMQNLDPFNVLMNENNEWGMSESGLIDPANGDYRPKQGLINAGWRESSLNTSITGMSANFGVDPTIGAFDAPILPKTIRDLY